MKISWENSPHPPFTAALWVFSATQRAQKAAAGRHNSTFKHKTELAKIKSSRVNRGCRLPAVFQCAILHLLPKKPHHSYLEKESDNRANIKKKKKPRVHLFKASHYKPAWWLTVCYSTHSVLVRRKMPFIPLPPLSPPCAGIPGQSPNPIQPALLNFWDLVTSMLLGLQGTRRTINTFLELLMKSNLSDPDITELSSAFLRSENESQLQLWLTWECLTEILLCDSTKKAVSW